MGEEGQQLEISSQAAFVLAKPLSTSSMLTELSFFANLLLLNTMAFTLLFVFLSIDPSLISFFKSKQKGVGEPRGGTASAGIGGATSQAMEVDDTLHPTPTVESPANQPPFTDQSK